MKLPLLQPITDRLPAANRYTLFAALVAVFHFSWVSVCSVHVVLVCPFAHLTCIWSIHVSVCCIVFRVAHKFSLLPPLPCFCDKKKVAGTPLRKGGALKTVLSTATSNCTLSTASFTSAHMHTRHYNFSMCTAGTHMQTKRLLLHACAWVSADSRSVVCCVRHCVCTCVRICARERVWVGASLSIHASISTQRTHTHIRVQIQAPSASLPLLFHLALPLSPSSSLSFPSPSSYTDTHARYAHTHIRKQTHIAQPHILLGLVPSPGLH